MFNLIGEFNAAWLDAQRRLTFSGLIRLGIAGFTFTGEVLATVEWIREVGRPFNTAIQFVSPARLSNPSGRADDANLRRGVQRDSRGKPVGYYIRVGYPTEWYYGSDNYNWKFVPIEKPWGRRQVIHIADQMQPDQTRGQRPGGGSQRYANDPQVSRNRVAECSDQCELRSHDRKRSAA